MIGFTVIFKVCVLAHWPAAGVNVYVVVPVVFVLMVEGDQVPVMGVEFDELTGKFTGEAFRQYGPMGENVGVIPGLIVIFIVCGVAHCPGAGVKVYVLVPVLFVLMVAGNQVPVMGVELVELAGRLAGVSFRQKGPSGLKVGVTGGVVCTVTLKLTVRILPQRSVYVQE